MTITLTDKEFNTFCYRLWKLVGDKVISSVYEHVGMSGQEAEKVKNDLVTTAIRRNYLADLNELLK